MFSSIYTDRFYLECLIAITCRHLTSSRRIRLAKFAKGGLEMNLTRVRLAAEVVKDADNGSSHYAIPLLSDLKIAPSFGLVYWVGCRFRFVGSRF